LTIRFPQKEILQDELPIAGGKRSAANSARYITVNGLWSGFGFDDLIKRVAMRALEMDCRCSDHDMFRPRRYPCYLFSSASQLILQQKSRQLAMLAAMRRGLRRGSAASPLLGTGLRYLPLPSRAC
jgi:hypothetical protein